MIDLIVNTGGNRKYWRVVAESGLKNGARLPCTCYGEVYFTDQNWKNPQRRLYMLGLKKHRPHIASVLDFENPRQYKEVISWATEAAPHVNIIVIIPKVPGSIPDLPREIGGKPVRLGYSVETSHGKTDVPIEDFIGWTHGVHLLGGNPLKQLEIAKTPGLNILSVDCNYIMLKANRWGEFLDFKGYQHCMFGFNPDDITTRWRQLKEIGLGKMREAPAAALQRSCETLRLCWQHYTPQN